MSNCGSVFAQEPQFSRHKIEALHCGSVASQGCDLRHPSALQLRWTQYLNIVELDCAHDLLLRRPLRIQGKLGLFTTKDNWGMMEDLALRATYDSKWDC